MRFFTLILMLFPAIGFSQLTWSDGAAQLVYDNCTTCHNDNGIAPFSLMDYESVSAFSGAIEEAVESGYMPPWTADDSYSDFAHSRALEPAEKASLLSWLTDGAPQGNPDEVPPPPVYTNEGFIQEPADLILEMDEHVSNATNTQDDYICVSIPTGLTEDKKIRGFEVIPGNPSILHHCLVYIDESGTSSSDFSGVCGGPNGDEGLIGGYAPGSFPTVFPSDGEDFNMGITLPAGSNIILALHYPHGSAGEVDQSKVRFYFYEDDEDIREVSTFPLLQNWSFFIPADTQQEVMADFEIDQDISVFSVFPHMHLVGEYIQAYAVTEDDETIPLVKIPHWDFEWQEFYFFQNLQKIPAGSTMFSNGTYNNTASNPHNPNDPPETITAGLNTTDEMFLVYFHFLPYMEGDENLDLEALTVLSTEELVSNGSEYLSVYPNPSDGHVTFSLNIENSSKVSLYVYNSNGRLIDKVVDRQVIDQNSSEVIWDATQIPKGAYYYSLMIDGKPDSGAVVLR